MNPTRSLSVLLGLGAALGACSSASAAIWDVTFQVNVTSGEFAGQTFDGALTYTDESLTDGDGSLGPMGEVDAIPDGLLAFSFTFDGHEYTITDDDLYPQFPRVRLDDGLVVGVEFVAPYQGEGEGQVSLYGSIFIFERGNPFFPPPLGSEPSQGSITFADPVGRPPEVPTPTVLAQGLVVGGLALLRRRRPA